MKTVIDVSGLDLGAVVAALYNAATPVGMGFMHYDPVPMTIEEGQQVVAELRLDKGFDYCSGRVMKLHLRDVPNIDVTWYNRDNGEGVAEMAIDQLRTTGTVSGGLIEISHNNRMTKSATEAGRRIETEATKIVRESDGVAVVHMGLDDVKDVLKPKLDAALKNRK
jgi:hypothetical protein